MATLVLKLDVQPAEQPTSGLGHILGLWGPDLVRYTESPWRVKDKAMPKSSKLEYLEICLSPDAF